MNAISDSSRETGTDRERAHPEPAGAPVCVLGVTGSVAAYKAPDIAARLTRRGIQVVPVLSEGGARFITPAALSATARHEALVSLWDHVHESLHLTLARADLVLVAPASADFLARVHAGLADDLLTALLLARQPSRPILVAPAMESQMWENPHTTGHVRALRESGFGFVGPVSGPLASGREGFGRMAEPDAIVEAALDALSVKDLAGIRVLVTAGPTHEPVDPVRYIGNRSSGKMGYALARQAARRGAKVTLVSGPTALAAPCQGTRVLVETAEEMARAVSSCVVDQDIVIAAAAVSDYRPSVTEAHKMHRTREEVLLRLERTPDVLGASARAPGREARVLVGFAAETEDPEASAREKLLRKDLDLVVGNDVSRAESTFGSDTNRVVILDREGRAERLGVLPKDAVADRILTRALAIWRVRTGRAGSPPFPPSPSSLPSLPPSAPSGNA